MSQSHLVFGEVKTPLVRNNLRETMEQFQKDADIPTLKKMADHLQLPSVPFDKKLILPVLLGEVQNAWYKEVQGEVPGQPAKHQEARLERYKANLEMVKNSDGTDLIVHRASSKKASTEPRKANIYRLVEKAKDIWSKYKGQKYLIVKAMQDLKAGPGEAGCTVKQISDTVRDTPETKAPNDKNCAFHINAFGHEGVIEKVEDGKGVPVHEEKEVKEPLKSTPPKADPKKPAETPKKNEGKGKKK